MVNEVTISMIKLLYSMAFDWKGLEVVKWIFFNRHTPATADMALNSVMGGGGGAGVLRQLSVMGLMSLVWPPGLPDCWLVPGMPEDDKVTSWGPVKEVLLIYSSSKYAY